MVAFKDLLSHAEYIHFLYLCTAIRLCSCRMYVRNSKFKEIARNFLLEYCKRFIKLYGSSEVVSNIHSISHILEDVDEYGSLTEISTYPFENYLHEIKLRVQAANLSLEQISRRLIEISFSEKQKINLENRIYEKAAWTPEVKYIDQNKFKFIRITPNVFLSVRKTGDKWFLTKSGEIVAMKYATVVKDSYFIHGVPIKYKYDFFSLPYSSHITDIYSSNGDSLNIDKMYELNQIKAKLFCMSYKDNFVFIPLLHSLDELNEMAKGN